ncbi:phage holin [Faecalibacterium prausnitzii]
MLPIESQIVEQLVTASITTVAALVAWWKNNSFPPQPFRQTRPTTS